MGLDPILSWIDRSNRGGDEEGSEFFDLREAELDTFLFPNLVRYYAKSSPEARELRRALRGRLHRAIGVFKEPAETLKLVVPATSDSN